MKICISTTGGSLDAQIDPRFGRCPYFVIVDSDTMNVDALPNMSRQASSGAGIQAAQTVINRGAQAVITGQIGPNAFRTLSAAGIPVMTRVFGTAREAVERFQKGELKEMVIETVGEHFGTGRGRRR